MARVLLVAGHGDGDSGACANGICEADLTRTLALQIQKNLTEAVDVFDITRNLYKFLKNGGSFDFSRYDYILELHFNAGAAKAANGMTTGCELLVHTNVYPIAADEIILKKLAGFGFRNRGIKYRADLQNMNIIKKKGIPYALLEVCFIDDPDDMQLFNSKTDKIAKAISEGLSEGFGLKTVKELESVNDIVWELAERGIITDKALWLKKLAEDNNAYWLARKAVRELRK